MKKIWKIAVLLLCLSCSKAVEELPEGSLLDKVVVRNLNNNDYKYFTLSYAYESSRLVSITRDIDGTFFNKETFEYDSNGRLTKSGIQGSGFHSYLYDSQNRIIRITEEPGAVGRYATFEYNAANQVVKYSLFEKTSGNQVNYLVFEYDSNGEVVTREVFQDMGGSLQSSGKFTLVYDNKSNPYYSPELKVPSQFGGVYSSGTQSKHNYLFEKVYPSGIVASNPFLFTYQRNGLPKSLTYGSASKDSVYYFYK